MVGLIAKSSIKTSGLLGLRVITQALSLVLLTRYLGTSTYGNFVALATLAVVMGAISNFGAGYLMLALKPKCDNAVAHVWRFAWPLTIITGIILLFIYYGISQILINSTILISNELILLLGSTELILMPLIMLLSFALQSHNKVPLSQLLLLLTLLFKLVAIVLCFFYFPSTPLYSYIVFQFISVLLSLIFALLVVTSQIKLEWKPRFPELYELSRGAKYASMGVSNFTASEIDKILVINWLNNAEASIYSATSRIVSSVIMPVMAMLLSAQPKLFQNTEEKVEQSVKLIKTLFWLTCLWGGSSWILLTLSASYIAILFGEGFESMADIMPLLAFVSLPFTLRKTAGVILASLNKPMLRVKTELLGMCLFIVLIMILFPQWQLTGFIYSLLLSEIIMSLMLWFYIYNQIYKVNE